jgi:glycerate 2-kinase
VAAALRERADLPPLTLVVAAGKAAAGMLRGASSFFTPATRSIVLMPRAGDAGGLPASTVVLYGGHPHPTSEGFESTRRIAAEIDGLRAGDHLLFLVSGGASALLEAPPEGIGEADLVRVHEILVASGLEIAAINLVRGCLSAVKAGRLAERARPARVTTLAISDVEGDDPRAIGSGPTVPPLISRAEAAARALAIVREAGLALPPSAFARLECDAARGEGQGASDEKWDVTVVASSGHAVRAAQAELRRRGYDATAVTEYLHGDTAAAAARVLAAVDNGEAETAKNFLLDGEAAISKAVLLDGEAATANAVPIARESVSARAVVLGGETTVALGAHAAGRGGRNLDLAARLALVVAGRPDLAIVVAGTDGCDGSSRAAGAVVDGGTAARAERRGFPLAAALAAFDTEPALEASEDLVVTGPTGTNVGDLVVAVWRAVPGSAGPDASGGL